MIPKEPGGYAKVVGSKEFTRLVDPVTLDYCYAGHGQGYRTTCARLQKEV